MSETAIILCSRINSNRIYQKPLQNINGKPVINHLVSRCLTMDINTILACPNEDAGNLASGVGIENLTNKKFMFHYGQHEDPLRRMYEAAKKNKIKNIIRINHDKIFIEPALVYKGLDIFHRKSLDYLYSSEFTDGSSFEIISFNVLEEAIHKYKNVEHISYAIRSLTQNSVNMTVDPQYRSGYRLLIDYPEDLQLIEVILSQIGNNCTLLEAIDFLNKNKWAAKINELPELTIYTCAYNMEKYINQCMGNVTNQADFKKYEYILVDDFSSDKTPLLMAKQAYLYKNIKWFRNTANMGLAFSSNMALKQARGKYIMRIDGDDYFTKNNACQEMISEIQETSNDVIYPNNYFGDLDIVQNGKEKHHIGGAIFKRSAVNHIKFTDQLRNYDGLDFFTRAREQLKVGYLNRPMFFYRQRKDSMSRTNLIQRQKTYNEIMDKSNGLL